MTKCSGCGVSTVESVDTPDGLCDSCFQIAVDDMFEVCRHCGCAESHCKCLEEDGE